MNSEKGKKQITKIKKLDKRLKNFGLSLDKRNLEGILDGINFMYNDTDNLISEIADYGKCEPCGMSEGYIKHEKGAEDMEEHLICSGCEKVCDGGKERDNDDYNFFGKGYGAYVYYGNKREGEGYCKDCKFDILCGKCGYPHELDTSIYSKYEYSDYYGCLNCEIQDEEDNHKENHGGEPNLDCGGCQNGAEKGENKTLENK